MKNASYVSIPSSMEHEHSPEGIRRRLGAGARHNYLHDFIYGGMDGAVTTFAVVAGTLGANLSSRIVLIMGTANLLAAGFSMAASNFLGTRAEADDFRRLELVERRHIKLAPEGEREEVRQIYEAKGFVGAELERVVELITSDDARWVETMLREEYGLPREVRSAWLAAAATYAAFLLCGLPPLAPFVLGARDTFAVSALLTCAVFFLTGALKSRWSIAVWWRSGLVTLAVGGAAAGLAYVVGTLLKNVA